MNIIIPDFPVQRILDTDRPSTMFGASSGTLGIVRALGRFRHAEDRLIAYAPASTRGPVVKAVAAIGLQDRFEVMDDLQLREALAGRSDVVIQAMGAKLRNGLHLRWLCGSPPWPVVGVTYSLSAWSVYENQLVAALGPTMPYDAIICLSDAAANVVGGMLDLLADYGMPVRRPQLIRASLGVETEEFTPLSRQECRRQLDLPLNATIFTYLGRIEPRYKVDIKVLLHAFSRMSSTTQSLLVIGAGAVEDEQSLLPLKLRCTELGLQDRVRWFLNTPFDRRTTLLSASDVFVSPVDSLQESFGLTLLEAMGCALPVIASDWDGYRDIVIDGVTGCLIPTILSEGIGEMSKLAPLEDVHPLHWQIAQSTIVDTASLAAAMSRLAGDSELRVRMGLAGRARAVHLFDWSKVIEHYRQHWMQLIALASVSDAPPAASLYWYNLRRVFESYPTKFLTGSAVVRMVGPVSTESSLFAPPAFLNRDLLLELVQTLKQPVPIDTLRGDLYVNLRHIAYLIKQGLAEIVEPL